MSNELTLIPTDHEMKIIETICKNMVESKYFTAIGGFAGAICIALYAREIGVAPVTALMGGFSNVQGRISMSAELMHALIRAKGHRIKILRSDNTVCEIYCKRCDTGDEYTSVYTIEDAKRANLVKAGGSYEKNPSDMLFARNISRIKRRLVPDLAPKAIVDGDLDDAEFETVDTSNAPAPSEPTPSEYMIQFKEKFASVQNMDYDLDDYLIFYCKKFKKEMNDAVKGALKKSEIFTSSYLKWVEDQKPVEEISAVDVPAKEMTLV